MEPKPTKTHLPTEDEGYQIYKASGKLTGKKALITGGDSGIGRAVAILFAMEGADVAIAYLPAEEEDAQHTKAQVEKNGGRLHLFQTDVAHANNCKELVRQAVDALGGLNILVNNAAYQMEKRDIEDTAELVVPCIPAKCTSLLTQIPESSGCTPSPLISTLTFSLQSMLCRI